MTMSDAAIQPILWYPMRVTYQRELVIKQRLDELGIENFLPMRYETVEESDGGHLRLVPALHNLIFLHATFSQITELKTSYAAFEPLRYMVSTATLDGQRSIITVPDKQMDDFIRVATADQNKTIFLDYGDYLNKEGRRVRIIEGTFAGVEGVIKRIKKNKCVVVSIPDIAAVAISYVPFRCLELL